MTDWPLVELVDSPIQIIDGDRGKNYPQAGDFSQDGYCLFLNARNVSKVGFSFDEVMYISKEKDQTLRSGKLQRHDVVLTTRGTVGNVAYYGDNIPYEHIRINSGMVSLRTSVESFDPRFVYAFVRSAGFVDQVEALTSGSAQPQIPIRDLRRVTIPIPPIGEQRAIAEVLGALDDKIAANTKLVEIADQLAGSLTRRAIDLTQTSPLSLIANLVMGSSPAGTSYNEVGEGAVFYQGIRDFGMRYPENRVWTTDPVRMAQPGDTLLSVRAPVGRLNLASEETCIGRGVASLRSPNGKPFTLFHVLKDSPEVWAPFEAEGTVFGSINKKQLESLEVPTVRIESANRLESELVALEGRIANALAENFSLAATRDALLPQLMSGKLRVSDAEALVSAAV